MQKEREKEEGRVREGGRRDSENDINGVGVSDDFMGGDVVVWQRLGGRWRWSRGWSGSDGW